MSKFTEAAYTNKKEILKFPDHYVAVAVTIDDAGVTADASGKKIVPAGTILGGGVLADPSKLAKKATTTTGVDPAPDTTNAEGVLLNDVDVTYGPASGAMLIHGFVDLNKIPTAPTALEKDALKQITFIA
ncbi:hypothetical protein CIG75_19010 [Tumebacillus algifaecis]|uniref:Head decoration protein n=1 Tax=Tumebacillus algifaecis TaxID=1214604 RepID=A0A223D622_9BACL|nr:hypothetical protein [Tumebacillus algifaecis]ASS76824.1 hypothetical protein CIG75_19010 [Tumebacillus algifaecis]